MPHQSLSSGDSHRAWLLIILLVALSLTCRLVTGPFPGDDPEPTSTTPPATNELPIAATTTEVALAPTHTPMPAAPTPLPTGDGGEVDGSWPAPSPLPGAFEETTITDEQWRTLAQLQEAAPPPRDDVALAMAYEGVTEQMLAAAATPPAPQLGDLASFFVWNYDSNFNVAIDARLNAAGEHAYFWFDNTLPQPDEAALEQTAAAFDLIYERNVANFGQERSPGIDGDRRLHILNASPGAICDNAALCGLLGYFSSSDTLSRVVNEYSNEREMFVMNGQHFGTAGYIHVLAHEFRHMIEDNYDQSDADWAIEGSATLAEELAGFAANAIDRGNAFLANPDQQLNRWTDGNTYPYYGQGYVLNRYIYDRLGPDLYREFATHPADGLQAVTAVARENGLNLDGELLWLDWLAALAIHNHPQAADIYRIGDGSLRTAAMSALSAPATLQTTVRQYAADYYLLEGDNAVTIQFEGSRQTPLLEVAAASSRQYWYAQRMNYSHMQLERVVDLSNMETATLNYDVYHDIEAGYDFAYVSVSADGGLTWQGLEAEHMQGLEERDDPGDAAFADRFYTGKSGGWVRESVDLTPYTGSEMRIRFSYITDPILTFGGLALDNISIPELGFFDDAEREALGWEAQGFTRATATLPQQWHLQLITFPNGTPEVTRLALEDEATISHTVELAQSQGQAILIVAAVAPMTLEVAEYQLVTTD